MVRKYWEIADVVHKLMSLSHRPLYIQGLAAFQAANQADPLSYVSNVLD